MAAPSSPKEVKAVADANTDFSSNLFTALKEQFPANLVYSPFSLSVLMAMVRLGAKGKTATEIDTTFCYPTKTGVLVKGYASILAALNANANANIGYTLSSANRVYTNIGFRIKREYAIGVQDFSAEVEQLDFTQNVVSAATINGWVDKTTHGKIKQLLSPEDLIGASLILVNGIYFKGLWSSPFEPEDTNKEPFFLNKKDTVDVDMMSQTDSFLYGEFHELGAHAVVLPYQGDGNRLCMIVIAPMEKTGLARVEQGISKYSPKIIFDNLYQELDVAVRLPKFKMECTLPLNKTLQKMGSSTMFGVHADFSGIPEEQEQLVISKVIQKAFIEVNEEGTEAAAASAATGVTSANPKYNMPMEFNADRPFIFQIIDRQTNFVLFAGRCTNPLQC